MTIDQMILARRAEVTRKLAERNALATELRSLRDAAEPDEARITEVRTAKDVLDGEVDALQVAIADLETERAADQAADALARTVTDAAPSADATRAPAVVTSEPRAYSRETDPKGVQFTRDVAQAFATGDPDARERLARHMKEERVERGAYLQRAVGTSAFAGLTIPQYLVDLVAPSAKAGRPFADACRKHDLPAQGMTIELSKVTTGTSVALQASQNAAVSSTDIDDTQLSVPIKTNAGQQILSIQAIERSTGAEALVLDDLLRSYNTNLDSTLLNEASTGLTNKATAIAYTDASPTAAELFPKLSQGAAAVEAALVDMELGDPFLVMHSRRWHWLNSNLSSTYPLVAQPGVPVQTGGVNERAQYGSGFRGMLTNGMPVVVDNNITTAAGAGTEDEIYVLAQSEAHLWEDANAPVFIRAEQTNAASLGVLLVAYGYFGYTFERRAHAQKIGGTGLIAPTF